MKLNDYSSLIKAAIKTFWETKQKQLTASGDSSNRGAVVGGKQLDAFADMFRTLAIERGFLRIAYIPVKLICLVFSAHPKTGTSLS